MRTRTGSDKLDLTRSVLGSGDPLRWMSLATNKKNSTRELEGKWWSWVESRLDMKCLSNLSWIGIRVLSRWYCSYWAANPVNPSRTVCLPASFILSDRQRWSVCRMWLLPHRYRVHLWESNKPVCLRVFVGLLSSHRKSVFLFEKYCSSLRFSSSKRLGIFFNLVLI